MMDSSPRDPEDFHKIWTTTGSIRASDRRTLQEYSDKERYRAENPTKNHTLKNTYMVKDVLTRAIILISLTLERPGSVSTCLFQFFNLEALNGLISYVVYSPVYT